MYIVKYCKIEIFRVATHELGGLHLIADMETKYSTKQLYDMLEIIEVHDTLKKLAHERALAEAKNNR